MAASHTAAEVSLLFNCVLILSLNDMTTRQDEYVWVAIGIMLAFARFVDLSRAMYDHIPRKASITNEILLEKVQFLYYE